MKRIFRMIRLWFSLPWLEYRARRCAEIRAGEISAETFVEDLRYSPVAGLEITASLPRKVMAWWGEIFMLTLFDEESTNFWAGDMRIASQEYEIRIQRTNRPTPAQKLRRCESILRGIVEGDDYATEAAKEYLDELPGANPNNS